ncbi:MAG TPA: efflux RND transporter permease subunit [Chloroflexota bacterium]|nr:efflux RND transporter permease subunit [Chloroflexota bacterium]
MKVTEIAVHHPLVVAAFTSSLAIFGILAYTSMSIAVVPNVNFPSVTVSTPYPGADPETVEAAVTTPIESALATLQNIDVNGLTSTSLQGMSVVQVQFNTAADPNTVSTDAERVVNGARNQLPPNPNIVPSIIKLDPNAISVVTVAFTGDQPLALMEDFAENVLQKQFNNVPGVSSTTIQSGLTREVHVLVNEGALRARGLAVTDVVSALQSGQFQTPAGTIWQGDRSYNVYFDALAHQVPDLRNLVVKQQPSGPVYLRDVATVQDTYQQRQAIVRVNGQEGLAIGVAKTPQASTIDVVNAVKAAIDTLQPQLSQGTRLDVVVDRSVYTQQSFNTVQRSLVEAVIATGLILLLFIHTWRSTAIVLLSIPTSVLTAFAVMSLLGYNLNLMTMRALTLAIGILVDDSIVVLENIARHLGMGKNPIRAAIEGRSEIGLAAITITMVDVVVYVPIAIMVSSVTGQFIRGAQAFGDIFKALAVAILLMYMLMMMLFNSVTLPLAVIVMMSLPLATVGAFGAMALTDTPFTLFSLLGFAVLLGLVGKNAILLVDYTEILEQRGYNRTDALLEAGPTRLRPILMTTLSVMSALLPIASGLEEGSELLKAAAVVLIGGLLTSTLLTLVFVPAMFTVFDDIQRGIGRLLRRGAPENHPHGDTGTGEV